MKKRVLAFLSSFLMVAATQAQAPAFKPINVGDGVNTEYNEVNPVLSPDGKTLYFGRWNHPLNYYKQYNTLDVWFSELQPDGSWGPAIHMDNYINTSRYNAILGITSDGRQMLISGKYSKADRWYEAGLSMVYKDAVGEWSEVEKLRIGGMKRIMRRRFNASISPDGTYIVASAPRNALSKTNNIYISQYSYGKWSRFKKISKNVNEYGSSEEAPFLSPNNELMYFSSRRDGVGPGSFDIYVTKRSGKKITDWGDPTLLEGNTNTEGYESFFKPNIKATEAYYVSSTNSKGGTDIFKIKLKEERPYVVLRGFVNNALDNTPLTTKKDYKIEVKGLKADSIKINYDSASFEIHLPFGKKYAIVPSLKNFTGDTAYFDATDTKEYIEVRQDLKLTPFPYVLVRGNFVQSVTGIYVPANALAKVFINGALADSAKINVNTASYEIKLKWGEVYNIQFRGNKYITFPDTLDLTKYKEYTVVTKDLIGLKEPEVEIVKVYYGQLVGKVINRKTGQPFANVKPYTVVVDKIPYPDLTVNTQTGEYFLKLQVGDVYVINAKADGYLATSETIDLLREKIDVRIYKDLIIAPIEVGTAIKINNIFFPSGKAVLDPRSFPELDKLAKFLLDNPSVSVEIQGHTDNVGKPEANMQLSRWRARSVEQYLQSKGVPDAQVTFNGFGQTKPVADNKTPQGKALNRRVEMVIKGVD